MARVLLVEDDEALSRGLTATLCAEGYSVDPALNGEDALMMIADEPFAIVILDVGLPDISGFEVLKKLRKKDHTVPVIMLTARDALEDRIHGLDLGADDYLLKPFEAEELSARLRALLRRPLVDSSPTVSIGNLEVDRARCEARINGIDLELRRREWVVLERLIVHAGKVVSKERLVSEVFGYDEAVAPNVIEVYIARLRRKLGPTGPNIRTMRGLGYVMDIE
ncbi:response regulator transcription factor [Kordiimonas pumila]|uniref:Response regulator transcription factor n=1 Tax=Kordiimonas pumila TaxID=2161677 RepID=A0ABV7D8K9_9PROT|nr:response regulator transcription factor [Kordiimonas pumila]